MWKVVFDLILNLIIFVLPDMKNCPQVMTFLDDEKNLLAIF